MPRLTKSTSLSTGKWSRDQLLLAFRLYCTTAFGRLHKGNPDIIALAAIMGRTPSSVAMKAGNFASLDPVLRAKGITGLGNASEGDKALWDEFQDHPEKVAAEAEALYLQKTSDKSTIEERVRGMLCHPPE